MMEKPHSFHNDGAALYAMLHVPDGFRGGPGSIGVVFLHGWSGNRRGPHDILVAAARRYCDAGFPCYRFDFRGRGDSEGDADAANLATMISDTELAVRRFRCGNGHEWELPFEVMIDQPPALCPTCNTAEIMALWPWRPGGGRPGGGRHHRGGRNW